MGAEVQSFKGTFIGYVAMKVQDFGRFDGPLVLFGGVYSNFQALEALIKAIGDRPAICTGDVVAYCADASASVALVRQSGWPLVAGNCERQIADAASDCGCGFRSQAAHVRCFSRGWYPHAAGPDRPKTTGHGWRPLPDIGIFQQGERRLRGSSWWCDCKQPFSLALNCGRGLRGRD